MEPQIRHTIFELGSVHADNLLANGLRGIINSIPSLDDLRIKTGTELNELLFLGL